MPVSVRPVSSATSPWPPSWAMVMALRAIRHSPCGTTTASAATRVAITTHRSGSGWVPETSSQREATEAVARWSMSGGGSS